MVSDPGSSSMAEIQLLVSSVIDEAVERSIYARLQAEIQLPETEKAAHGPGGRLAAGWREEVGVQGASFYRFSPDPSISSQDKPTLLGRTAMELAEVEQGSGSEKAIAVLLELSKDTHAPHRALSVAGISSVMRGAAPLSPTSELFATILHRLKFEKRAKVREALLQIIPSVAPFGNGTAVRALMHSIDDPDRKCRELVVNGLYSLLIRGSTVAAARQTARVRSGDAEDGGGEGAMEEDEDEEEEDDAAGMRDWAIEKLVREALDEASPWFLREAASTAIGRLGFSGDKAKQDQRAAERRKEGAEGEDAEGGAEAKEEEEESGREWVRDSQEVMERLAPLRSATSPYLRAAYLRVLGALSPYSNPALLLQACAMIADEDEGVRDAALAALREMAAGHTDVFVAEALLDLVSPPRPPTPDPGPEEDGEGEGGGEGGGAHGESVDGTGEVEGEENEAEAEAEEEEAEEEEEGNGLAGEAVCLAGLQALQSVCPKRAIAHNPRRSSIVSSSIARTLANPEVPRMFLERLAEVLEAAISDPRAAVRLCGIRTAAALLAPGHHMPVVKEILRRLETVDVSQPSGGTDMGKMQGLRVGDGRSLFSVMERGIKAYTRAAWKDGEAVGFGGVELQRVRLAALEALPEIARRGDAAAAAAVITQVLDRSPHVRLTAINALAKISTRGIKSVQMAAVGLLQDSEGLVRQAAVVALTATSADNDELAIKQLAPLLDVSGSNKRDTMIRNQAALALNLLSDRHNDNTISLLTQRLTSKDPQVRETSVNTLVELVLGNEREGQKVLELLLPLLEDEHWYVVCAALRGISRIDGRRQEAAMSARRQTNRAYVKAGRRQTKPLQSGWEAPVTQKVVLALQWDKDDRAATVRETALETLKVVALKGDVNTMRAVLAGLLCEDLAVRKACVDAVRILGAGDLGEGDYYETVIETTMEMLTDLSKSTREVAELELERDQLTWRLRKSGVDRAAIKRSLANLETAIAQRGLTREAKALAAGRMSTVMDCLCKVVPKGHTASIKAVASCFRDTAFDVRDCALRNLLRLAEKGNGVALSELVSLLASPAVHCRWAAAEALLLVAEKGDRKLLANMLLVMDSPDRFLRQDLVGAICGVLLPSDFAAIVAALGDSRLQEQLKALEEEERQLDAELHAEQERQRAGMEAVEREIALLEGALQAAERDLRDDEWVEHAQFWEVEARRRWVQSKAGQLEGLWLRAQGHGPAYHALLRHQSKVRGLAVQALTSKVADDKQQRTLGLALCKAVPGMQEFAKDLQLGVGQSWLSGTGMTRAKQVFEVTRHKFNQQARSKWTDT